MVKSGLIVGGVMFLLVVLTAAGVSPLCALCVPLVTGLGAGYLTGVFEKPVEAGQAAKCGAIWARFNQKEQYPPVIPIA